MARRQGRPTKFKEEFIEQAEKLCKLGATDVDLADFFAPHMLRCAAEMVQDGVIYVPVPLHRWRLLARRFNQSAALCRALARLSPYGVETNALRRIRATPEHPVSG